MIRDKELRMYRYVFTAIALILTGVGSAMAADFRIETDVFLQGEAQPVQQSLTLFADGVAYDYSLGQPSQVMIVDVGAQRIVLIDSEREVRAELNLSDLNALMESAKNQAANSGLAVYLSDAESVQYDVAENTITVGGKVLKYQASLREAKDTQQAALYRQFADASAYFNAWRSSTPPPFARIALNVAVGNRNSLPQEITRTTFPLDASDGQAAQVVKCRLHRSEDLSNDDRTRVAEFKKMAEELPLTSVAEYFAEPKQVAQIPAQSAK